MYNFKFADIGEGLHEGQILKWNVKVGDKINEGETLVIIETDKVNAEIPSPVTGIVKKLGGEVGDTIYVGQTLAIIDDGSESDAITEVKNEEKIDEGAGVVGAIEVGHEVIASPATTSSTSLKRERTLATPIARKIASDAGLDINTIVGTGENGRVLREDVIKAIENKSYDFAKSSPQPFTPPKVTVADEDVTRIPITKIRKAIVNSMVTAKSMIPHTTMMEEINVTNLVDFRKTYKDFALSHGVKLTYMPFIVKAVVLTLKEYPIFNASYDHEKEEIIYHNYMNIGIAVDTPDGLIVPNIKNADRLSIFELAREIEKLSKQATERTLQMNQIQGGTFTISNYGSFDVSFGTPIIKYPESAILGVGKINKKPIVVNGEITIGDILPLSLSVDHRIIDGADAARFIMKFKEYITNPMLLLMN